MIKHLKRLAIEMISIAPLMLYLDYKFYINSDNHGILAIVLIGVCIGFYSAVSTYFGGLIASMRSE